MFDGKMWDLEAKLAKIPMYIENPNFNKQIDNEYSNSKNVTFNVN
jgi:hypothetical protein